MAWSGVKKFNYELIPKRFMESVSGDQARTGSPSRIRNGCLLRFEFGKNEFGYSDCISWPEIGDLPLQSQLKSLKNNVWTDLTRRSLYFAQVDAQARTARVSLWGHLSIPASNGLILSLKGIHPTNFLSILNDFRRQGFTHLKLKIGLEEISMLTDFRDDWKSLNLRLRLDFNHSCEKKDLDNVLNQLRPIFDFIEYIEDICPYDPTVWKSIQSRWGVCLALDRMPIYPELELGSFSFLVFKPAIQNPEEMLQLAHEMKVPLVITSYLGHPLGQLAAAWVAAQMMRDHPGKVRTCGLLSHFVYEESLFSRALVTQGPYMTPPAGLGFGMEEELSALEWTEL